MGDRLRPCTHGLLILIRDSMLPYEREYFENFLGYELTLTSQFLLSSKTFTKDLKNEFVRPNYHDSGDFVILVVLYKI